jgi:ABC-2 type transport system permease protein
MAWRFLRAGFKSGTIYRVDFTVGLVGTLLYNGVYLSAIGIITYQFQTLAGWGLWELVFLYGLFMASHSIYEVFFYHLSGINRDIMDGELDKYYYRPVGMLVQLLGKQLSFQSIASGIIAAACLVAAYSQMPVQWSGFQWVMLPIYVLAGTLVETAVNFMVSCLAFFHPNARSLWWSYFQLILVVQRYPLIIFGGFLRLLLTCILPLAFINYYPALHLLNKQDEAPFLFMPYISPLVAAIFIFIAAFVFHAGTKRYQSSGS